MAVLAVLALALAACASDSPAAVTVDSNSIDQETVNGELAAIATNKVLKAQVASKGKINAEAAATWVTQLVPMQVAKAVVDKAGTEITKADKAESKEWANSVFGEEAFGEFPKSFRDDVLERYSYIPAYVRTHSKAPTDEEVRGAYDAGLKENCPSGRYVSHIQVANEADAKKVTDLLASGSDFAQVAASSSTDSQTASAGGAYGCLEQLETAPTFAEVAAATPVGSTSAAVQLLDGWHIIKVDDVQKVVSFESAKAEIVQQLQSSTGRAKLAKLVQEAKIKIAPRYGRWVVTDGQGRVEPPKGSTSSSSSSSSSSTTSTTTP